MTALLDYSRQAGRAQWSRAQLAPLVSHIITSSSNRFISSRLSSHLILSCRGGKGGSFREPGPFIVHGPPQPPNHAKLLSFLLVSSFRLSSGSLFVSCFRVSTFVRGAAVARRRSVGLGVSAWCAAWIAPLPDRPRGVVSPPPKSLIAYKRPGH